jgi:hypothetical protein
LTNVDLTRSKHVATAENAKAFSCVKGVIYFMLSINLRYTTIYIELQKSMQANGNIENKANEGKQTKIKYKGEKLNFYSLIN